MLIWNLPKLWKWSPIDQPPVWVNINGRQTSELLKVKEPAFLKNFLADSGASAEGWRW